jgi:hypothetical protein
MKLKLFLRLKWILFCHRWMMRANGRNPDRFQRATWRLYEWLCGARKVATAEYCRSPGCVCEPGIDIEGGGQCPVQWEGEIDGQVAYYRARGQSWSLSIGDDWCYHSGIRYHWPDAGYPPEGESSKNIRMAVKRYRADMARLLAR